MSDQLSARWAKREQALADGPQIDMQIIEHCGIPGAHLAAIINQTGPYKKIIYSNGCVRAFAGKLNWSHLTHQTTPELKPIFDGIKYEMNEMVIDTYVERLKKEHSGYGTIFNECIIEALHKYDLDAPRALQESAARIAELERAIEIRAAVAQKCLMIAADGT